MMGTHADDGNIVDMVVRRGVGSHGEGGGFLSGSALRQISLLLSETKVTIRRTDSGSSLRLGETSVVYVPQPLRDGWITFRKSSYLRSRYAILRIENASGHALKPVSVPCFLIQTSGLHLALLNPPRRHRMHSLSGHVLTH